MAQRSTSLGVERLRLVAELFAGGDHQRLELVDLAGASADRLAASEQQHPQRLAIPALTRLREMLTRERFPGRPHASRASDFAPLRLAARTGRSTSSTHSPCPSKNAASPAP